MRTGESAATQPAAPLRQTLAADEAQGGHTIREHAVLDDRGLRARFKNDPDLEFASTFGSEAAASKVVGLATKETTKIDAWLADQKNNDPLAIKVDAGSSIGRVLKRGADTAEPTSKADVVLKRDPTCERGYYVHTA